MAFSRKSGSLAAVWIKSLATEAQCSFCSGSKSRGMNFAMIHFMSKFCVKTSDMVVFRIPRSASSSLTVSTVSLWSLLKETCAHSTFSGVLLVADLPQQGSLSTDAQPALTCVCHTFYLHCPHRIIHESFLNHRNSFHRGLVKLNAKLECRSIVLLAHFECDGHTVHMLTQQSLLPPLTSAVKPSLFTHAHSTPLSLAARLYQCHANCSRYINNGWTFSGQTLYSFDQDWQINCVLFLDSTFTARSC